MLFSYIVNNSISSADVVFLFLPDIREDSFLSSRKVHLTGENIS